MKIINSNLKPIKYIFGIDPGTGSKSACGVALIEADTAKVVWTASLYPKDGKPQRDMEPRHRIKYIVQQLMSLYEHAEEICKEIDLEATVLVSIEAFVIKGKGGVTLEHMKGAALSALPVEADVVEVQNTVVKKIAGGSGKADKIRIGQYLKELIPESKNYIEILLLEERWDEIDAIGIAYSAREIRGLKYAK